MSDSEFPTILILGAHGMLGHTVFNYLHEFYTESVWGTVKNDNINKRILSFDAYKYKSLDKIVTRMKKIDYIINCIGSVSSDKNERDMHFINTIFPHKLTLLAEKHNAKLIHISTDGVFSKESNTVYEDTPTSPADYYGETKLQGEPLSLHAITIRTSIIGLDPYKHKGLLEFTLKGKIIKGYTNQFWSGCTTLQYATLCHDIISSNSYQTMRNKSSIFHFAPISNVTKHDIINTFLTLLKNNKTVVEAKSEPVSRLLVTRYPELLYLKKQSLQEALYELVNFEKIKNSITFPLV